MEQNITKILHEKNNDSVLSECRNESDNIQLGARGEWGMLHRGNGIWMGLGGRQKWRTFWPTKQRHEVHTHTHTHLGKQEIAHVPGVGKANIEMLNEWQARGLLLLRARVGGSSLTAFLGISKLWFSFWKRSHSEIWPRKSTAFSHCLCFI